MRAEVLPSDPATLLEAFNVDELCVPGDGPR